MISINNLPVTTMTFSGGEVNPRLPEGLKSGPMKVVAHLQSSDDIMNLLMVLSAIEQQFDFSNIKLVIPYMPYARQDRVCVLGEAFGFKAFLRLIPENVTEIISVDIHNKNIGFTRTTELSSVEQASILASSNVIKTPNTILVAPDASALQKTKDAAAEYSGLKYIQGSKLRDPETGKLSGFSVDTLGVDCEGKTLLIIDDICDGGGTFIGLAEELKKLKPKALELYVTHGIFSKGFENLNRVFDKIHTTDTFIRDLPESVNVIQVMKHL